MSKFKHWFITNNTEITWCLIGFMVSSGLEQLARGQYIGAAVSFGLAYLNYAFRKILP